MTKTLEVYEMKKKIEILGKHVKDKVTGFKGVATSISFDLYGCIQLVITPYADKENKNGDGNWYDIGRIKILDHKRVLDIPDFGVKVKGPAEKPIK